MFSFQNAVMTSLSYFHTALRLFYFYFLLFLQLFAYWIMIAFVFIYSTRDGQYHQYKGQYWPIQISLLNWDIWIAKHFFAIFEDKISHLLIFALQFLWYKAHVKYIMQKNLFDQYMNIYELLLIMCRVLSCCFKCVVLNGNTHPTRTTDKVIINFTPHLYFSAEL